MLWQNPGAYRDGVAWLLRQPAAAANRQVRKMHALIARYLQRYCAKNDCIGFFGPLGWGTFVDDAAAAACTPGAGLLARRTVYFEHWGIDELAAQASRDRDLLPYLVPRRNPAVRVDRLPADVAELVTACDGVRDVRELAGALALDVGELCGLLEQLRERKLVYWALDIPIHTAFPEHALRERVAAAPAAVRDRVLAPLAELETARDRVAAAAGDPDALDAALAALAATFERATGRAATRRPGEVYAGRTLVYEDCRRNLELRIGPAFLARLGPPLALVLQSARWYTHAVAERWRAHLRGLHDELAAGSGEPVEYLRLCERAAPIFGPDASGRFPIVADVVAELQRRWAELLGLGAARAPIALASSALAPAVAAAFAAPQPGWPLARFHSPDILVAARSAADVVAGDARFVLGELHTGRSMLTTPIVLRESPDPEALQHACRADVAACRVAPVAAKAQHSRLDAGPVVACDFDIELGATASQLPRDRVLAIADLVVVATPSGLVVETRDRRVRLDLIACLERNLLFATLARFALVGQEAAHVPRVTIDELVIARERWQLAPGELDFATARDAAAQLAGARRWAAHHGMPRHVFVRVPEERKPIYVDLESPVLIDVLARLVRAASAVTVTEMLPTPDELWLADRGGGRYTCELRITAVDPVAWRPSDVIANDLYPPKAEG